jgi:hypothetical protein
MTNNPTAAIGSPAGWRVNQPNANDRVYDCTNDPYQNLRNGLDRRVRMIEDAKQEQRYEADPNCEVRRRDLGDSLIYQ